MPLSRTGKIGPTFSSMEMNSVSMFTRFYYGGAWKKRPELWVKAKHLISLTSDRLYLHHQREAEEAARIWHCHASPRKKPEMEGIWTD